MEGVTLMLRILIFIYLLLLCILAISTYLYPKAKMNIFFKSLTSLGFILISGLGFIQDPSVSSPFFFLFIGLILCALGDVSLALSHNRPLKYNLPAVCGIIFFSLAHLSFITCFIPLGLTIPMTYFLAPMLLACLFLLLLLEDPFDFGTSRFLIPVYTFIISTMLLTSVFTSTTFIIIGAILFVVSDIVLCFVYFFGDRYPSLRPLNYLFYYIGQLLLALVIFYL